MCTATPLPCVKDIDPSSQRFLESESIFLTQWVSGLAKILQWLSWSNVTNLITSRVYTSTYVQYRYM